jgi:hypothetical protein
MLYQLIDWTFLFEEFARAGREQQSVEGKIY